MSDTPISPNGSKPQQKRAGDFPVSESYKVLEGYDIYRSEKLIVALVVVESSFGRDIRLYRWQKRNDSWKVDLCRMSVALWNWDSIGPKAIELMKKYEIAKKGRSESSE